MVEPLEEEAVAEVEDAVVEEATATTTMVEEVLATTMEVEVAKATTMDIRTISIGETNNTPSRISNNKCPQQLHCLIQQAVQLPHG